VAQSAVVGRTIEGDEEILAFVQPSPGSHLTEAALAEYAAKHLAPYKRPTHIVLVSNLPMTPSGKIAKADLAKMAAEALKHAGSPAHSDYSRTSITTSPNPPAK
jgi:acyl-coenzyme A synthetase/AMP-(fatty) acid ligase